MNDFEVLIPIVLFLSIAWTIKAVLDARVRRQMVESNGSEALVRSILEGEEDRRRHGSLRWGIVLLALGIGFAAVDLQGVQEVTPGVVAALLVATGLGNLAYFLAARRLKG